MCGHQKSVQRIRSVLFLLRTRQPLHPGRCSGFPAKLPAQYMESEPHRNVTGATGGPASAGLFLPHVSLSLSRTSACGLKYEFFSPITESESIEWMGRQGTETVLFFFAPRWPVSHARKEETAFRDCGGEDLLFLLGYKTRPLGGQIQRYSHGREGLFLMSVI